GGGHRGRVTVGTGVNRTVRLDAHRRAGRRHGGHRGLRRPQRRARQRPPDEGDPPVAVHAPVALLRRPIALTGPVARHRRRPPPPSRLHRRVRHRRLGPVLHKGRPGLGVESVHGANSANAPSAARRVRRRGGAGRGAGSPGPGSRRWGVVGLSLADVDSIGRYQGRHGPRPDDGGREAAHGPRHHAAGAVDRAGVRCAAVRRRGARAAPAVHTRHQAGRRPCGCRGWDEGRDPAAGASRGGGVLGAEQWGKGANVVLAPTVNIVRDPRWGRAFEAFSEDPHLSASMGVAEINGIQSQGAMAQVKHLAAYNEETFRDTVLNDAIVDPRVLHEVYLRSFQAAVDDAHVASVMCAYNEVNHVRDCEDPYLMDQVLKGEFGFGGFVTSDWFAITSSAPSVNAGLDMQMPDDCLLGTRLASDLQDGSVARSRLDDMVRRILGELFAFNLFNKQQTGTPWSVATNADHAAFARTAAEEGTVLLKNAGRVLPFDPAHDHSIAVIGGDAGAETLSAGGGSAKVVAPYVVTPLKGIKARAGKSANVTYDDGSNPASAAAAAQKADVAVVFVNLFTQEDRDLPTINLPANENALVAAVAAANPNTVVVLHTGSAVVMPWLDQVKGVVEAWYPGQESGNAIASVLFGDVNPSGKLPVTFPASQA